MILLAQALKLYLLLDSIWLLFIISFKLHPINFTCVTGEPNLGRFTMTMTFNFQIDFVPFICHLSASSHHLVNIANRDGATGVSNTVIMREKASMDKPVLQLQFLLRKQRYCICCSILQCCVSISLDGSNFDLEGYF